MSVISTPQNGRYLVSVKPISAVAILINRKVCGAPGSSHQPGKCSAPRL
jgi:hypothetical protein